MALRCRQIGRRGLNRKTVMIDRFHVSNYPLYKFSAKNMTKCPRVHFGFFFVPLDCRESTGLIFKLKNRPAFKNKEQMSKCESTKIYLGFIQP